MCTTITGCNRFSVLLVSAGSFSFMLKVSSAGLESLTSVEACSSVE